MGASLAVSGSMISTLKCIKLQGTWDRPIGGQVKPSLSTGAVAAVAYALPKARGVPALATTLGTCPAISCLQWRICTLQATVTVAKSAYLLRNAENA